MTENDRLAKLILQFCRAMLENLSETTSKNIVSNFQTFVRKHNLN